jgi:hypothetical protein
MKQITKNTILRQNDKTYQPVEVDGIICWIDKSTLADEIVAQSQPKIEGVPVISLNRYVESLAEKFVIDKVKMSSQSAGVLVGYIEGFNSNPNQYTQKDIDKTIAMSKIAKTPDGLIDIDAWISSGYEGAEPAYTEEEILEQINQISVIEVDDQFNIVSYE